MSGPGAPSPGRSCAAARQRRSLPTAVLLVLVASAPVEAAGFSTLAGQLEVLGLPLEAKADPGAPGEPADPALVPFLQAAAGVLKVTAPLAAKDATLTVSGRLPLPSGAIALLAWTTQEGGFVGITHGFLLTFTPGGKAIGACELAARDETDGGGFIVTGTLAADLTIEVKHHEAVPTGTSFGDERDVTVTEWTERGRLGPDGRVTAPRATPTTESSWADPQSGEVLTLVGAGATRQVRYRAKAKRPEQPLVVVSAEATKLVVTFQKEPSRRYTLEVSAPNQPLRCTTPDGSTQTFLPVK